MTTAVATRSEPIDAALIERVLIHGDLRQLTPAQKVSYYKSVCESVGLNPLTQPFQYLVLNGKEILYATRAATEQLRKVHAVSVQIMAREIMEDCYIVTARATLPSGRQDENIGAVPVMNLKGEARANAMMKAETKAKRRVTLAICGLGMLDETEVASIQADEPKGYVVTAAKYAGVAQEKSTEPVTRRMDARGDTAQGNEPERLIRPDVVAETVPPAPSDEGPDLGVDLPPGARRILEVRAGKAGAKAEIVFNANPPGDAKPSYGTEPAFLCFKPQLVAVAEQLCQNGEPCFVAMVQSASGNWRVDNLTRVPKDYDIPTPLAEPLTADEIPF